jgi:DNA-directed RNA polymerase specialized sigma24 family protein
MVCRDVKVQEVQVSAMLEGVFREDYAQLCRLAAIIVGDAARAEELVMDAFARCLGHDLQPDEPHTYLRRAVVNRCRSHLRRRGIEWRVNATHHARSDQAALPVEPDDEVLTYFADLPEAEVAAILGCSAGTVKSQLSKARSTLARSLEKNR